MAALTCPRIPATKSLEDMQQDTQAPFYGHFRLPTRIRVAGSVYVKTDIKIGYPSAPTTQSLVDMQQDTQQSSVGTCGRNEVPVEPVPGDPVGGDDHDDDGRDDQGPEPEHHDPDRGVLAPKFSTDRSNVYYGL